MLWVFFISGCANIAEQTVTNSKDKLRLSVAVCAESLNAQLNTSLSSFFAVNAVGIDYFVVIAEQASSESSDAKPFCHVDKASLELAFDSVSVAASKVKSDSIKNEPRYKEVYLGGFEIKEAAFIKYKLINGIWRQIEERTIIGS